MVEAMLVNASIIFESIDRARTLIHQDCRVQRVVLLTRGGDVVTAAAKLPKCIRVEESLPEFRLQPRTHLPADLHARKNCVMCYRRDGAKAQVRTQVECVTCKKPLHVKCWAEWHAK